MMAAAMMMGNLKVGATKVRAEPVWSPLWGCIRAGWVNIELYHMYVTAWAVLALMSRAVGEERGKYIPHIVICFSDDQSTSVVGVKASNGNPGRSGGPSRGRARSDARARGWRARATRRLSRGRGGGDQSLNGRDDGERAPSGCPAERPGRQRPMDAMTASARQPAAQLTQGRRRGRGSMTESALSAEAGAGDIVVRFESCLGQAVVT